MAATCGPRCQPLFARPFATFWHNSACAGPRLASTSGRTCRNDANDSHDFDDDSRNAAWTLVESIEEMMFSGGALNLKLLGGSAADMRAVAND
jgi:hypothetical protein